MKFVPLLGALILLAGGIFALYMAFHLYSDHQRIDVFHLIVGTLSAVFATMLFRKGLSRRS